jgi:hypothetical protein
VVGWLGGWMGAPAVGCLEGLFVVIVCRDCA